MGSVGFAVINLSVSGSLNPLDGALELRAFVSQTRGVRSEGDKLLRGLLSDSLSSRIQLHPFLVAKEPQTAQHQGTDFRSL